jgi:hypothetical protein
MKETINGLFLDMFMSNHLMTLEGLNKVKEKLASLFGHNNFQLWLYVYRDPELGSNKYITIEVVMKEYSKNTMDIIDQVRNELKHIIGNNHLTTIFRPSYDEDGKIILPCPKGGNHEWGIDGAHSNEFCKKCFISYPEGD